MMPKRRTIAFYLAIAVLFVCAACTDQETEKATTPPDPTASPLPSLQEPSRYITSYAITPDGSLWYAFDEFDGGGGHSPYVENIGLYHLKDSRVQHFDVPDTIRVLEVGPDGSLYVGAGCGVLRYREGEWETLANVECDESSFDGPMFPLDVAFAENGDVWVGGNLYLARFDGQAWTEYDIAARRILIAPDGTLWADGWDGVAGSDCCYTHLTGATWVTYTHTAPLPVSEDLLQEIHRLRR